DGLLFLGLDVVLGSITSKVFNVEDDGDIERAAGAASNLFSKPEIIFCDLEEVSTRTG
ncbi:hypothetical protein Ancab_025680, partial [Ancistrocladus abbreviatus]